MLNFNFSNVFVGKGYGDKPAIEYKTNDAGEIAIASFGVSSSVYDSKAENKRRYVNFTCKAFGDVAKRIEKMKLDAGANINISGSPDVETWEKDGNKRSRVVFIVEKLEYNSSGKKKTDDESGAASGETVEALEDETFDDLPF